jgi:rubredoxin
MTRRLAGQMKGLKPGTRWDDVPVNWVCPECDARKEDFELVEI